MFLSCKYGTVDLLAEQMTIRHWMRLSLLCRPLVRRNVHLCSGFVLEQTRLLYVYKICFGTTDYYTCIKAVLEQDRLLYDICV